MADQNSTQMDEQQSALFSQPGDIEVSRFLLADLHDDLEGKVARFRQLADLSTSLGSSGTMIPGGETAYSAWVEARSSFVHGNFVATVMLCQGLAEHLLAAHLSMGLGGNDLPARITFRDTLNRCLEGGVIGQLEAEDLSKLMGLRNPLSHYRAINDPSNLSRRILETMLPAEQNLLFDATFAIGMAIRLLSLPAFRLGE